MPNWLACANQQSSQVGKLTIKFFADAKTLSVPESRTETNVWRIQNFLGKQYLSSNGLPINWNCWP